MRIKFERMNFDAECAYDLINERGFLISELPYSDIDKTIRNLDGPRSPRYGTQYEDANAYVERFRCACGQYVGSQWEGETCPKCGTKIEYKDVDMLYTGWINLYPYHIINPLHFHRLQSALSKKVLENIIASDNMITSNGVMRRYNNVIEVKKNQLMYHNIGIDEFYHNFEEIMTYYLSKRKQKADLIERLIKEKDIVFCSKLPVYSTTLRPTSITMESYYFNSIDRQINPLVNMSINLKTAPPIEVPLYLYQCQLRANEIWKLNFQIIDGKHGWIRSNILGGCFNYSARSVIILDPTLKLDEVDVPYKTFAKAYSGLIVKRLVRERGWSSTKAFNYIEQNFKFNEDVYHIIEQIVAEEEIPIVINRNPTITYGSILKMKIRRVKNDPDDLTLSLPSAILPG